MPTYRVVDVSNGSGALYGDPFFIAEEAQVYAKKMNDAMNEGYKSYVAVELVPLPPLPADLPMSVQDFVKHEARSNVLRAPLAAPKGW